MSPASNDVFLYPPATARIRRLVGALHRLGVMGVDGLAAIADHWAPITLKQQTHWQEILPINRAIIEELVDRDLTTPQTT